MEGKDKELLYRVVRKLISKEAIADEDITTSLNITKKELNKILKEIEQKENIKIGKIRDNEGRRYLYIESSIGRHNTGSKMLYVPNPVRIGIVTDTHLGSKYDMVEELNEFYHKVKDEVDFFLHSGDIIDGMNIYRGQIYDLRPEAIGIKKQVEYLEKHYPKTGKKTYFIRGNHDQDKANKDINIVHLIKDRDDLVYLGDYYAEILLVDKDKKRNKIKISLVHGDGGGSYAISYKPQTYLRGISPKERSDIYIFGHWHSAGYFWYEDVLLYLAGCMQRDYDFLIRKGLKGERMGSVLNIYFEKNEVKDIIFKQYKY